MSYNYKMKITPELLLLAATILKVVFIFFFYQHVIDSESSPPRIVSGYGWDELVSSMYQGKYEMLVQSGLSDIYDLKSHTHRPPIYPIFLFVATYLSNYSAAVVVFLQSIITSLVAYLGYRIVRLSTNRETLAVICLWTLFLFPMNFLKSGTVDEAPLMLVFILASLYIFGKYMRNQDKLALLVLSGILLGLSTMTRFTTLFIAAGILFFLLISRASKHKRFKNTILFILSYILILSPWLFRNYLIYGGLVLVEGGGQALLFTQSEEFIESFPNKSADIIEREYLRTFQRSHHYLSQLDTLSLDKEFTRYAISEMANSPEKALRAFIVKLKAFLPYRYFPKQNNIIKDIVYTLSYSLSLLFFLWSILKCKRLTVENVGLLIALGGLITQGIIYFILSRHLYPPMILMIIFSYIACSNALKKEN